MVSLLRAARRYAPAEVLEGHAVGIQAAQVLRGHLGRRERVDAQSLRARVADVLNQREDGRRLRGLGVTHDRNREGVAIVDSAGSGWRQIGQARAGRARAPPSLTASSAGDRSVGGGGDANRRRTGGFGRSGGPASTMRCLPSTRDSIRWPELGDVSAGSRRLGRDEGDGASFSGHELAQRRVVLVDLGPQALLEALVEHPPRWCGGTIAPRCRDRSSPRSGSRQAR